MGRPYIIQRDSRGNKTATAVRALRAPWLWPFKERSDHQETETALLPCHRQRALRFNGLFSCTTTTHLLSQDKEQNHYCKRQNYSTLLPQNKSGIQIVIFAILLIISSLDKIEKSRIYAG